jgi:ATP-dependent DNA ligase
MFDMTDDDIRDSDPYEERLIHLLAFFVRYSGMSHLLKVLPTAKTMDEKEALLAAVIDGAGEGVLIKHRDGGYTHDARVTHSLKYKITHTVDAVVMAVNDKADCSATLGLWVEDKFLSIGSTSMIGKGTAEIGDVLEVKYLYVGSGGSLVQPSVVRKRTDKHPSDCTPDQLIFVNKKVIV